MSFEALAQDWADIWNGDLAKTLDTVHPDFESHAAPLTGGAAQDNTGRDKLNVWVGGIRALFPDLKFVLDVGPLTSEPYIVLRWRAEGIYAGGFPGAAEEAVGRRVVFYGTDILRIENDLIKEYWANADSLWFAQQLGFTEVPPL